MKRRNFIKLSATASAIALLPSEVSAMLKQVGTLACPNFSNRKLVLIQLAGGNDGINTLVPMNQYDTYAQFRPTLRLPLGGTHGLIQLDGSLGLEKQLGLHPALTGFKNLYKTRQPSLPFLHGYIVDYYATIFYKQTDLWWSGLWLNVYFYLLLCLPVIILYRISPIVSCMAMLIVLRTFITILTAPQSLYTNYVSLYVGVFFLYALWLPALYKKYHSLLLSR